MTGNQKRKKKKKKSRGKIEERIYIYIVSLLERGWRRKRAIFQLGKWSIDVRNAKRCWGGGRVFKMVRKI